MASFALALALLASLAVSTLAACPSNGAPVGFSGPLTTIDHGVRCPDLLSLCVPMTPADAVHALYIDSNRYFQLWSRQLEQGGYQPLLK